MTANLELITRPTTNFLYSSAGGKAGAVQTCHTCRGSGTKISLVQIGPGMVQQTQRMCPDCHGEGT